MTEESKAFFSYSRLDAEFALKLAKDLRNAGASVWIDQLDISPGDHWDITIQKAVGTSSSLLVVLSPNSVESENVMDEVSFAIEEKKLVIPVLYRRCDIPLRLRRVQYIDVQTDYEGGLQRILTKLQAHQQGARDSAAQATQLRRQSGTWLRQGWQLRRAKGNKLTKQRNSVPRRSELPGRRQSARLSSEGRNRPKTALALYSRACHMAPFHP